MYRGRSPARPLDAVPATAPAGREDPGLPDTLSANPSTAGSRLSALINIGLELASERNSEKLLQYVCVAARDLFDATDVTLGTLDPNDGTVERVFSCGGDANAWVANGDPLSGIIRTVVMERRTVVGDARDIHPGARSLPSRHPQGHAYLVAPIASPARVHGWICVGGNEGRAFTDEDARLLTALSGQVGRIYETGDCYVVAQRRTEELEREVVERRRVEAALREERDRTQRYLDTAEVILLALDREGRVTLINRYACAVLGWTAAELLGRDFIETCVPARLREGSRKRLENIDSRDDSVVENAVLTRAGEERLIEWRTTLMRDDEGKVVSSLSSGADVTQRKAAEEAKRASEERYRALFEYAPDGIVIADRESTYLDANASVCRMLGYSRDELIGMHATDIVVPAEVVHIGSALLAIAATTTYQREWQFRRKDGSVFLADVIATTMPDGNLLAMIRDVTERNRAVAALRTAEERMRFALNAAGVGIWDMDYVTGALQWSETLEAQYGLTPGTFGGTFDEFISLMHPDDRAVVLEDVGKAMTSGADFSVLNRAVWPDGTVRWLSGSGRILLGAHGEPVRGVGVSMDITERRMLEQQYQQGQKMEAIGRLAGGVAHDFNNLLTGILGYCELLLVDLSPEDPRRSDIAEIQKAGTSAAELTRQLLAFSRKQVVEPTLLDLNGVVDGMQALIGRLIGEDIKVVLGLRASLAAVTADRAQVEQIVMNLAVNARDAMPGGGTLTIETANVELDEHYVRTHLGVSPGPYVALIVSDTGTGMTLEVQARLFEPFFTTKELGKGTGLGLATVHGIVLRSGGSVNVYSEVGRGSSFKVYFPRADAAESVSGAPSPAARTHVGAETVLVVEDADGLRGLARRMLERQGYTVLIAAGAEEAQRLFKENPSIDLLLTDVIMPGVSGPELARRLSAERPGLKVIYMSGYTDDTIGHHGVLEPGVAFLQKPFTSEALGRKVREALER